MNLANPMSHRPLPPPTLPPQAPSDAAWRQILTRDPAAAFLYAVRSTGIVCRAACPSRRPLRANTLLFPNIEAATQAGFRPCLRCQPHHPAPPANPHAQTVASVTAHLAATRLATAQDTPTLAQLALATGHSPIAIRRAFRHLLALTPAQFLRTHRLNRLRSALTTPDPTSSPITDALQAAGFNSPSRLYESSPRTLGMTPTSLRRGAPSETILYTLATSPLGRTLVATTPRGICAIHFADSDAALLAELQSRFPHATLTQTPTPDTQGREAAASEIPHQWLTAAVHFVLAHLTEHPLAATFPTDVRATAFQHRVWQALQAIPRGQTLTYAQLAASLGQPTATRAVARACAQNPLALANPCHRVIATSGALTGYRWGLPRKQAILKAENP